MRALSDALCGPFLGEVDALPVDLFRVLAGVLAAGYFLSLLGQVRDFGAPSGLLDPVLVRKIYWFTRLSLFPAQAGAGLIEAALLLACACAAAIALGWRVRPCAAVAFAVAVSYARRSFPVIYVEDTIMQATLFWLLLLPCGTTLTVRERLKRGPSCWKDWARRRVPGGAVRCLLANICLVYIIAGAWKLTSPMWRDGFALYAVLRMRVSLAPDFWRPSWLPWLRAACYAGLAAELAAPFLLTRPRGSPLKLLGLAAQAALNGGIAATMRLPFANLAMLGTSVLFFAEELADRFRGGPCAPPPPRRRGARVPERLAAAYLVVLTFSVLRDVPILGAASGPATSALWLVGIAQDYRLFNWIDSKDFRSDERINWSPPGGAARPWAGPGLFPDTPRGALLESYLFSRLLHGSFWIPVPREDRDPLRESIVRRAGELFCGRTRLQGAVDASLLVNRITPGNADLSGGRLDGLARFSCRDGRAVFAWMTPGYGPEAWQRP